MSVAVVVVVVVTVEVVVEVAWEARSFVADLVDSGQQSTYDRFESRPKITGLLSNRKTKRI